MPTLLKFTRPIGAPDHHEVHLLPAQTTRRCLHRGQHTRCFSPATVRGRWALFKNGSPVGRDEVADRCRQHMEPPFDETVKALRIVHTVEPLAGVCDVCGADLKDGYCVGFEQSARYTSVPFSCECATCVIYGGDCARVMQREGMSADVFAHRKAGKHLRRGWKQLPLPK